MDKSEREILMAALGKLLADADDASGEDASIADTEYEPEAEASPVLTKKSEKKAKEPKSEYRELIPHGDAILEAEMNVMLVSMHGAGKTTAVKDFCKRRDLKLVMFNAAMMDPYVDLIGIPMPKGEEGERHLEMVGPEDVYDADVVFVDELNRAEPATQNALMKMVDERELNGRRIKAKVVFAAINPPGGDTQYHVSTMDPAMQDRWDLTVELEPEPSIDYLATKLPKKVAQALVRWWSEQNHRRRDSYISPRRLEKLGRVFMATKDRHALKLCLPPGIVTDHGKLYAVLASAIGLEVETKPGDVKLAGIATSDAETRAGTGAGADREPIWLKAPHGESEKHVRWAGKHSTKSLIAVMEKWSQPTQSRFRTNLKGLLDRKPGLRSECGNVIDAINHFTAAKSRI